MSHAPEIEVAVFLERLEMLQSKLESVAVSGVEAAQPVELDQSRVGRLSRMDAIRSQAMSVESERRRTLQLSRIRAAIKRIEDGEFGYCSSCGDPIAPERLEIDPAAHLCIACASAAELSSG
jgi:DnaK suppressor protein